MKKDLIKKGINENKIEVLTMGAKNFGKVSGEKIYVKSHVARDLIQSADLFKNEKSVVWEYVSNGLEYIDEGTNPI